MKKIIIIIFLQILPIALLSQALVVKDMAIINDSIKYQIILKTGSITEKNKLTGIYFVSIDMSQDNRKRLLKETFDFWLPKLLDTTSDWAANITLHYLFKKDASEIAIFKTRHDWLAIKDNQIEFWKTHFINRNSKKNKNKHKHPGSS